MYKNVTITPAYGRDYTSQKAVEADWKGGKDFVMEPQKVYCSIRDLNVLKQDGNTHIHFRYNKLTKLHVVKIK